jgi:3-methyladenine DNA glycosylase AlkD
VARRNFPPEVRIRKKRIRRWRRDDERTPAGRQIDAMSHFSTQRALSELETLADPDDAAKMAAYHKAPRRYLGIQVPKIDRLARNWRREHGIAGRVALAAGLWDSDIHEARIAAAKLLTQARIPEGEAQIWEEFQRWVPHFDAWAIADHACKAGERRLTADPRRIDTVEGWTRDCNKWVRRAALVVTLPWSKLPDPSVGDREVRERVLAWAEAYVGDRDWFIQKAISWWLRSLSLRDPARVRVFLVGPGRNLKAFARRDAARLLDPQD